METKYNVVLHAEHDVDLLKVVANVIDWMDETNVKVHHLQRQHEQLRTGVCQEVKSGLIKYMHYLDEALDTFKAANEEGGA